MFPSAKGREKQQFLDSAKAHRIERERDRRLNQSATTIQVSHSLSLRPESQPLTVPGSGSWLSGPPWPPE